MDIIRFTNTSDPTKLEHGEIINGLKSKMWVERYAKAGEFKFVADVDTGMREKLPIGSLITHTDTAEVMIVENHEIVDGRGNTPEITISGRGFETFLENRIVGGNKTFPTNSGVSDYVLSANYTWDQLVYLIEQHILSTYLTNQDDAIPYVSVMTSVSGTGVSEERLLKRANLYSSVLSLLAVDDLGIKVVRPGTWSPLSPGSPNLALIIHKGEDRTNSVIFSYDTGEIESAEYLWSNKSLKTAAIVYGKWVDVLVTDGSSSNYNRRTMLVEASDLDDSYTSAPTGSTLTNIVNAMTQRGHEALAAQKEVSLTKTEVSKETNRASYRVDFDVGDLISVIGDYNASSSMRITEYVEIEDENGRSGYPTLTTV